MGRSLKVKSLPARFRTKDLMLLFEPFGSIDDCQVVSRSSASSNSGEYGYVVFRDSADASAALKALDRKVVEGCQIDVQYSSDSRGGDSRNYSRPGRSSDDNYRSERSRGSYDRRVAGDDRDSRYEQHRDRDRRSNVDGSSRSGRDGGYGGSRDRYFKGERSYKSGDRSYYGERERSPNRGADRGSSRSFEQPRPGGGADEMMDPTNMASRIYISGLPSDTTEDELANHFGMLGQVERRRQRSGYRDQWPWKISMYMDDSGKPKGDASLTFVDPNAAQSAPDFFNGSEFKGNIISVELAAEKAQSWPKNPSGGRNQSKRY